MPSTRASALTAAAILAATGSAHAESSDNSVTWVIPGGEPRATRGGRARVARSGSMRAVIARVAVAASGLPPAALFTALVVGCGGATSEGGESPAGDVDIARSGESWLMRVGGPSNDLALGLAAGPTGEVTLSGSHKGPFELGSTVLDPEASFDAVITHIDGDGDVQFTVAAGNSSSPSADCDIARDSSGSILALGTYRGSIGFGGPPLRSESMVDLYLARLEASGAVSHLQSLGPGAPLGVSRIAAVESGGSVVLANEDIIRLDENGNISWFQPLRTSATSGDHSVSAIAIAATPSGEVAVMGTFSGVLSIGGTEVAADGDLFVAKFGTDGSLIWVTGAGGIRTAAYVVAGGVQFDPDGSVVVGGPFPDGSCFGDPAPSVAAGRVSVAKLDSDGRPQWCRALGGPAAAVATAPNGNAMVLEQSSLVELDPGGSELRRLVLAVDTTDDVEVDADGNTFIAGRFSDALTIQELSVTGAGAFDVYLAKLAPDGW